MNLVRTSHFIWLSILVRGVMLYPQDLRGQEETAEQLIEGQEEISEQNELLESMEYLKNNPLDLNSCDSHDLEAIPGISIHLRNAILAHRNQHGHFSSREDLLHVRGISKSDYESIKDFVKVDPISRKPVPDFRLRYRFRLSKGIESPLGAKDGRYPGSMAKIYNRLKVDYGTLQAGLLLEKDGGESRFDDLKVAYVAAKTNRFTAILGNYLIAAGQGLALWGSDGLSKSGDPTYPTLKRSSGIRGSLSVNENSGFWGVAASLKTGALNTILFLSRAKRDASPLSETEVAGLRTTGLHRTDNEKIGRDLISESVFGGRVVYSNQSGYKVGMTYYAGKFSKVIQPARQTRDRFELRGNRSEVLGLDWQWSIERMTLFGEIARSASGGTALLTGASLAFARLRLALLYRSYRKNFQNLHATAFAEYSGAPQNERGFYLGIASEPAGNIRIKAYVDIFYRPWRSFNVPMPYSGHDLMLDLETRFQGQIQTRFRVGHKRTHTTSRFTDGLGIAREELVDAEKTYLRGQLEAAPSRKLKLRTRVDYVVYRQSGPNGTPVNDRQSGFLMYEDFSFAITGSWRISGRVTFFESGSYDARLFQYERDLPGVGTIRALSGRGASWYIVSSYRLLQCMRMAVKYSELFRDDVEKIGAGADEIDGNVDRQLGVQFELTI